MEISDLTGAVGELWAFLWPRVTLLVIFIAATWFVGGQAAAQAVRAIGEHLNISNALRARAFLRAYGLTSLIPIAALFTCLFFLFAVAAIMNVVGDALPPTIIYMPDTKLAGLLEEPALSCLEEIYPSDGLASIVELAGAKPGAAAEAAKSRYEGWSERSGTWVARFNTTKALLAWLLIVGGIELYTYRRRIGTALRLVIAIVCCCAAAIIFVGLHLYAVEQDLHTQARVLRYMVLDSPECQKITSENLDSDPNARWRIDRARQHEWWRVEIRPVHYWTWIYREFVGAAD